MLATNLRKTGRYKSPKHSGPAHLRPRNLNELRRILEPKSNTALPVRPHGAGTAATDCNQTIAGTILHMDALDRVIRVDTSEHIVTVEAGLRLEALVETLAEDGLELIGGFELQGRTVGGAVAAPCFGACIGGSGSYFSSHVIGMKVITASGKIMTIGSSQKNLLAAFRMSFGLLGIIYEVTLRVRPIRTFVASHRRVTIDKFASIVDTLSVSDVGFKFYLMPYRDRVYLDLRRYDTDPGNTYTTPWKLKDWGESTVMPHVFKSLNRIVPIDSVKYRLIDSISEATQGLVNSRLVQTGTNAASQSSQRRESRKTYYSTWCFPAANFSMIAVAYKEFCEATLENAQYRCDLPAVGYRLSHDSSSPLSPSFDETMIALTTASTQLKGWDDFVIDLAEFAEKWGGTPLISQSRALRAEHVIQTYANRLDFFRRTRRQLDPEDHFLSPFLAQFAQ
jgi:FAD/FMN-containing dehydrogenase